MKDPDHMVKHEREDRECELMNEIERLKRENEGIKEAAEEHANEYNRVKAKLQQMLEAKNTWFHRAEQAEKRVGELEKENDSLSKTVESCNQQGIDDHAEIRALEATVAAAKVLRDACGEQVRRIQRWGKSYHELGMAMEVFDQALAGDGEM